MMTDEAQECAQNIDTVGYNYLERLYNEHHEKYPDWKIYGSETGSTVQSRGIYHFPETLMLVTFNDGQYSCLGNCAVQWGGKNTQTVISMIEIVNLLQGNIFEQDGIIWVNLLLIMQNHHFLDKLIQLDSLKILFIYIS